jgi:hypothetical protein
MTRGCQLEGPFEHGHMYLHGLPRFSLQRLTHE